MITGLLQNKYICISYKSKPQIKDLTRIFHVLIENRIKNTALQNYVRLLVGRSIFGQGPAATFVYNKCKKETKF